jgi:hypothetical protein
MSEGGNPLWVTRSDRVAGVLGRIFLPKLLNGRLCGNFLRLLNYVERFSVIFDYGGMV